ncbi:hypothetical protein [Pseudomonas sp. MWU15-20650]|uniref:hypothetical protein n=1 Tax=Pseudomonas sp. MWU15-20650 TaxID=2933107 RepID=UPI002010C146|nr:hypothetical protein [Pseudomonas sp. MWU15-20650]
MDIASIGRMLSGLGNLDQMRMQGNEQQKGGIDPELLKKLIEMLSGNAGAQGGGGSSGSGGSGAPLSADKIKELMASALGMQAMMPDSDNGRQIQV